MNSNSTEILGNLLKTYETYFDISYNHCVNNLPVEAEAEFHSRSEKYVLVKKANLWSAESHEYTYFVMVDSLTPDIYENYRKAILEDGLKRIEPKKDHMCSYVSLIIITNSCSEDIHTPVLKTKFHKEFRFSIYGWMDYRVAVYDCSTGKIYTNRAGKDLKKNLQSVTK